MKKNWKTTFFGISTGVAIIISGVGLVFAKDHDTKH